MPAHDFQLAVRIYHPGGGRLDDQDVRRVKLVIVIALFLALGGCCVALGPILGLLLVGLGAAVGSATVALHRLH